MEASGTLKKAAKGNRAAVMELYERSGKKLMLFCRSFVADRKKADRIAADIFTAAIGTLAQEKTEPPEQFAKLLLKEAVSVLQQEDVDFKGSVEQSFNRQATEDLFPKAKSDKEILTGLVDLLPAAKRLLILLHYVFHLEPAFGAELMGLEEQTCSELFAQAQEDLQEAVKNIKISGGTFSWVISFTQLHQAFEYAQSSIRPDSEALKQIQAYLSKNTITFFENRKNRIIFLVLGVIFVGLLVFAGVRLFGSQSAQTEDNSGQELHHVEINIRDYGTIEVELNATQAPITVKNFMDLAEEGFYDGLTFHRIIDGFMMQGGDPNGDGTGGSGKKIKGEFLLNGVDNTLSHTRGAISMARSDDYDSASSQFFIMQEDNASLDGQYAVFGYVTSGMKIVDAICEAAEPTDDNGTISPAYQPVIESIKVID